MANCANAFEYYNSNLNKCRINFPRHFTYLKGKRNDDEKNRSNCKSYGHPQNACHSKNGCEACRKAGCQKPAKATPKTAKENTRKAPKVKTVRDSFSMPQDEYQEIAKIKDACKKAGLPVKKSAVLRAGLKVLGELNMAQMKRLLAGLTKAKAGRPNKA